MQCYPFFFSFLTDGDHFLQLFVILQQEVVLCCHMLLFVSGLLLLFFKSDLHGTTFRCLSNEILPLYNKHHLVTLIAFSPRVFPSFANY